MKKRLLVSFVATLALGLVAAPAFGQSTSAKSVHKAQRSNARVVTGWSAGIVKPAQAAPLAPWTNLASMVTGVGETGGGAFAGTRFYVPGGFDAAGSVTGQMQIFNATAGTWSKDADLLSTLTGLPGVIDAAVCSDNTGKIHVINGSLDGASIYASHLVFTPTAPVGSKWSALALPNTVADGNLYTQDSGCSFLGGKLYLYSGYGLTDLQGVAQFERLTWVYDPVTDTWADTGKLMLLGRIWEGHTANSSRAFVCGGSNNIMTFAPTNKCETFTVAGGWKAMATLPAARLAPGMGFIGSTLDIYGGMDASFVSFTSTFGCAGAACGPGPWVDQVKTLNTGRAFFAWGFGGGRIYAAGGFDNAFATLASAESTA